MNNSTIDHQLLKLEQAAGQSRIELPRVGSWPQTWHCLDNKAANAIAAAILSGRPLLVRGEPGVGKSQLGRAAAAALGRRFIFSVIQPDTEYGELLWATDHTSRLADAQLAARSGETDRVSDNRNYIAPGALWWAFDWGDAEGQSGTCNSNYHPPEQSADAAGWLPEAKQNGVVLLIDEVDKADISLTNGLLEVLGNGSFSIPAIEHTVESSGLAPLVVLTSNDTREMPPALLRRCVVIDIKLPTDLQGYFVDIGETHYPMIDETIRERAAKQIINDRKRCDELPKTGLAEYLDLLTALSAASSDAKEQDKWLDRLSEYFCKSQAVER